MLFPRIIPCLDVNEGRVVKGVNFVGLRDAGDPVELAKRYDEQGADEIVFLDITASVEDRASTFDMVRQVAEQVFIPLTVGGGIRTVEDVKRMLRSGADKVSLNTAAVRNPTVLKEACDAFGAQCVVCAIDAKRVSGGWEVFLHGGRTPTGIDALAWAVDAQANGAGEILMTSMDSDGTLAGYDLELLSALRARVDIPIVASGGAGTPEHLADALRVGADAVLIASIVHDGTYTVAQLKSTLGDMGIALRQKTT